MNSPMMIGVKYVVFGIVSFVLSKFLFDGSMSPSTSAGIGAGAMACMVVFAAQEGYSAGKKESENLSRISAAKG